MPKQKQHHTEARPVPNQRVNLLSHVAKSIHVRIDHIRNGEAIEDVFETESTQTQQHRVEDENQ